MLPVSQDMLQRVVRRRAIPSGTAPNCIVGIDGFKGCLQVVTEWATWRRRNEKTGQGSNALPPARKLSHLMTMRRERLTKAEAITVAGVEAGVSALAAARKMLDRFHHLIRTRKVAALTSWRADSETGLLASFCKGIKADLVAVTAALTEPWPNGQTEGQITRLKLVKRQMYGRGGLTRCALAWPVWLEMAADLHRD